MIKAELIHNPYLLHTKVKFNDQEPKINSQIEKYDSLPLKDWVDQVPSIFYDEMNGYDFDFYFTGTVPDFNEIENAFASAGVTPDQVRLFHKNEIEDPVTKNAEIIRLLEWLKQNPNRKFDFYDFRDKNDDLFDVTYPFIIIGGKAPEKMELPIAPESVDNAEELSKTNLESTPILFYIEEERRRQFRTDLDKIINRPDIRQEQLFFMIDPSMNVEQVTRVISDLGVSNPQIVDCYDADEILAYVKNYPMTEYVRRVIDAISSVAEHIDGILEIENKESKVTNADIHQDIEKIDKDIETLKALDEYFVQRDNYEIPQFFGLAHQSLADQLSKWKNKKTKVVGVNEAKVAATDYSEYIKKTMLAFYETVKGAYQNAGLAIENEFLGKYLQCKIDSDYEPDGISLCKNKDISIPDLTSVFLDKSGISFESVKTDFFGLFKKSPEENSEQLLVAAYYLDQWRSKAAEWILPIADDLIKDCIRSLMDYYNKLADNYHNHLVELIRNKSEDKETLSALLSDDEKLLQNDNDWLSELEDQLQIIRRG